MPFWFCFKWQWATHRDASLQKRFPMMNRVVVDRGSCGLSVESVWLLLIDTLEEINNQLCCSNECTALPLTFESNTALTSTLLLYDMGYCAVDSVCPPNVLYHSQPCSLPSPRTSVKVVCFLSVPMKVLYIPPLQICLIHSVYRTLVLCSLSSMI